MSCGVLTLLLFFWPAGSDPGNDILNKTYAARYHEVNRLYIKAIADPDSASAFLESNALKALAARYGDTDLELETELLRAYYMTVWHKNESARIISSLHRLIEKATRAKNLQISARAGKVLGDYYWFDLKNYELGFETYIRLEQLLQKISAAELPDKVYHLQNMAQAYHNFSDYPKALHLFRQIVNLESDNDPRGGRNSALYSIGKIHGQLGNLDSSDYYYRKIIGDTTSRNYLTWRGIASGGLGHNCFVRGRYEDAVPFLEADVTQALKDRDYGLASGSLITLAQIFLDKNNTAKAEQYALHARKCLSTAEPDRYKHFQDLYPVLSKIYAVKGLPGLSGPYLDSAILARDSMDRKFNALQMMRALQKIELQKHRAEIEKAEADKHLKDLERNILLLVILGVIGVSGYLLYYFRENHRQKQQAHALELKIREDELSQAVRQLDEFAKNIQEKTRLIEYMEHRQDSGTDTEILAQLRKNTILTPDGWTKFKTLFEKVYSGYLYRLQQKFPDLTPAEIRFIALVRLGLNYQEMASILGVSGQAVRTTKYRLLKKINLPDDKSLENLVALL